MSAPVLSLKGEHYNTKTKLDLTKLFEVSQLLYIYRKDNEVF